MLNCHPFIPLSFFHPPVILSEAKNLESWLPPEFTINEILRSLRSLRMTTAKESPRITQTKKLTMKIAPVKHLKNLWICLHKHSGKTFLSLRC